ncbi:MAG: universal stress protein [Rhodospirillales bacterium]|nr:MAG: universal stress protein [Rhodospirillales bacterium]
MKRFKNVLVVYDDAIGGDDALSQAVALSQSNGARLTIATVLREAPLPGLAAEAAKRTERLADSVRHAGVATVDCGVLAGVPFEEIIRQVVRHQHDLVIMSAQAGKTLRDVVFGGAAAQVIRKCPCPVWVIRPGQAIPYQRILAAIDPAAVLHDHLNVKIMDLAASLASRDQALLHVVHAWDVEGKDLDTIRSEISSEQRQAILRRHESKRRQAVDALLAGYPMGAINHRLHLPRDLPERAIVSLTEREQIDLIVMGTEGRFGLSGLLLGNAVEAVLRSVECGILAVKPDHFETPVALPEAVLTGRGSLESRGWAA